MVIPEGLQILSEQWFNSSSVESVTFPVSLREIGADIFCNCESLKSVTFAPGSRLEKIGSGSFCKTGIERIVIPKSVTEIREGAFQECKNLKEVIFEEGCELKTIEKYVFNECINLAAVNLPDRLEKIGAHSFSHSGLNEVVLPESTREIGTHAFYDCRLLKSVRLNKGLEKLGEKELVGEQEYEGKVFAYSAIRDIRLPTTLKKIEERMFLGCKNLKSVEISNGVERVGKECFFESGTKEIMFPSTLKEIDDNTLDCCFGLTVVWVEQGCVVDIRKYVSKNVAILWVKTTVGERFLQDLRGLKDVIIPEGTECIGEQWFMNSEIESIIIPVSVTAIEREAFRNCKGLKRVTFAEGSILEKLGSWCFYEAGIEKIVIPKGVEEIQERAFQWCTNLREVVLERGSMLKTIRENTFIGCSSLATIGLPEGLNCIECGAFCGCKSLRRV